MALLVSASRVAASAQAVACARVLGGVGLQLAKQLAHADQVGRVVEHATSALRSRLHAGRDVVDTSNLSLADAIEQEMERKQRYTTMSEFPSTAGSMHGQRSCSSNTDDGMQRPSLPVHIWDQEQVMHISTRAASPVPQWVLQAAAGTEPRSGRSKRASSTSSATTSPLPQSNDRLLKFLHPKVQDPVGDEDEAACSNMTLMDALRQQRVKKGMKEPSSSDSLDTASNSQAASPSAYSNCL